MRPAIPKSFCNRCQGPTDHEVLDERKETMDGEEGRLTQTKSVLRCLGCSEYAIRLEDEYLTFGDEPIVEEVYLPPRLWRAVPRWLSDLEHQDPDLKNLLVEIYSAANDSQMRLLSMGIRAALDHLMGRILGGDAGPFEAKLDLMVTEGHLTSKQRDNMAIVIDAGSASSHRGFRPPRDLLEEMLTLLETQVREHYLTGPMLDTARRLIPPRPPRRRAAIK